MSFTCPRCSLTSHNPNDEKQQYCGHCHQWFSRSDICLRAGFYCGLAQKHFGDFSPAARTRGRLEDLTDEQLIRLSQEIHDRLVEAGVIRADEDPFLTKPWGAE